MGVDEGVRDAGLVQHEVEVLDVVAGRAEHDRLLPGRDDLLEQVEQRGNLSLVPAVEERHPQRLRDLGVDVEPAVFNPLKIPEKWQQALASNKNLLKHFDVSNLSFIISYQRSTECNGLQSAGL